MKLLLINGCIRGSESRTRKLMLAFLEGLKETPNPTLQYEQLNLVEMSLKPLVGDFFEERQRLLEKGNRTHPRFRFAHQFAEADRIVVAAPFWDLSVPAIVKIYIENISLDGVTFGCNADGMYGMCRAKELLFLTTRGGFYENGPMEQGAAYFRALCLMFGIPKFRCIYAEGIDFHPERESEIMTEALVEAREAGRTFCRTE
ncbi:MAG: NAD(P)H-dependent oxidoreductase [Lachnospiraceae bacterium]|nr:NAD(P)H-dependent oxidoreductase [Lachnospiraceae bacterium]